MNCRHCMLPDVPVVVVVPGDLSHTGEDLRRTVLVDACVAPLVREMQALGVRTRGSCCGHGEAPGVIEVDDRTDLYLPRRP